MTQQLSNQFTQFPARVILVAALTVLTVLVLSTPARADFKGHDYVEFTQLVKQQPAALQSVTLLKPEANIRTQEVEAILPRLESIVRDQVGIWSDTILEGDYDTDGVTRLDQVQALYSQSVLVGYKVTYSERAWKTGANGEHLDEGRIQETSIISANLTSWTRDDSDLADFATL